MKTILAAIFVTALSTTGFANEARHNDTPVISTATGPIIAKSTDNDRVSGFGNTGSLGFIGQKSAIGTAAATIDPSRGGANGK